MKDKADQLRLAADIIENGWPWEYNPGGRSDFRRAPEGALITNCLHRGQTIRVARPPVPPHLTVHNPDWLTDEQVGPGHRLCVLEELDGRHRGNAKVWALGGWREMNDHAIVSGITNSRCTFSVPALTPYPDKPLWKLPDPPAGREWHRTDWKEEMLPEGTRPLLRGEASRCDDDEVLLPYPVHGWRCIHDPRKGAEKKYHVRTRRPLPTDALTPQPNTFPQDVLAREFQWKGYDWITQFDCVSSDYRKTDIAGVQHDVLMLRSWGAEHRLAGSNDAWTPL